MNLICDEGVEGHIVAHLRARGHHVTYVAEQAPGISDDAVLAEAADLVAPLITNDKDFGELVYRQRRASAGVMLLRLAGLSNEAKAQAVASALDAHSKELRGAFMVITKGHVRIRRTPPSGDKGQEIARSDPSRM